MTDRNHTELMHEVLDREATPEAARELESLLAADAGARARFDDMRALHDSLASIPELDPPKGLADAVLARVKPRGIHTRVIAWMFEGSLFVRYALFVRYTASFAVGLLVAAAAYEIGGTSHEDFDRFDRIALAGTMIDRGEARLPGARIQVTEVTHPEVAGTVTVHKVRDRDLVLVEFALVSQRELDTVLPLLGGIEVTGLGMLERSSAEISLSRERLTILRTYDHRYSVLLRGVVGPVPVELYDGDSLIHRVSVPMPETN